MEDFNKQIQDTQASSDKLTTTVNTLYQKLADLNQQQADLAESGKKSASYYQFITTQIDSYKRKIDETGDSLTRTNTILGQQERALAASQNRTEVWGKSYEGVKGKVDKLSEASESFGKILGSSANNIKPMTESLKNAETVTSKFKDAIGKANQAATVYEEGRASGKSRLEAFKDVFPALTKGVEAGTGGMKMFKIALAETGIGLIVIAVAALIEKLKESKPVMDMISAVTASAGAVMSTLGNAIMDVFSSADKLGQFFLHPIDSLKKLGTGMAAAAKDAYNLSTAQEQLKTATSAQELVNNKTNDRIELLKKLSANEKLGTDARIKALQEVHRQEETYYNQNSVLAYKARDNAIEELRIKTGLSADIIKDLQRRGAEAAAQLLREKKINDEQFEAIKTADEKIRGLDKQQVSNKQENADAIQKINDDVAQKAKERRDKAKAAHQRELDDIKAFTAEAKKVRADSVTRMALSLLSGYDLDIRQAQIYYDNLLKTYTDYETKYAAASEQYKKLHKTEYDAAIATKLQLEDDKNNALNAITKKFQDDDLKMLQQYKNQLTQLAEKEGLNAQALAIKQLTDEEDAKEKVIDDAIAKSAARVISIDKKRESEENEKQKAELSKEINAETEFQTKANEVKTALHNKFTKDQEKAKADAEKKAKDDQLDTDISMAHNSGKWKTEFNLRQQKLDGERAQAVASAEKIGKAVDEVKQRYDGDQRKLDRARLIAQLDSQKSYLKSVDSMSASLGNIFGKNTVAAKAAFKAHQAAAAGQVIIDTQKAIMGIWSADGAIPFIGVPKAIFETAIVAAAGASSLASIIKQKPGFAQGGQFKSDGRGALLSGYSRTDDTNAYLRSGEAVVVSEAMRNPWARNLVSAINVAHGGRDFSVAANTRGYAIGGIFTDGGNANRYYSQPANDVKDLANTLAYQMLNNFPPIYVDVKDVNSQQNILAQTINRVNL